MLDIDKALKDGSFGPGPRGWGDDQWNLLINYVSAGIEFADEDWDTLDYSPKVWSTIHKNRERATPCEKGAHQGPAGARRARG